ncbi:hypothetical protein EXIGLDRAFT_711894 [Exidia glandulosa HHB12029]|uniref:Uncharacterized protein n=1 Tax=Exidia glandulosa HHB12029 TaxID=1314781 RepID=A0A165ZZL5_EXIGL|nr:hypothetical protein EXIGLDRAFT_711894 [Exidia glandulosa HHB12029]
MPLFALALNFGWEVVYGLFVTEEPLERAGFTIWLIVDVGLVYGLLRYGRTEWVHAPFVQAHLGAIFALLAGGSVIGHWTFVRWFLDNDIGLHRGKTYGGRPSADTTEMGYWSALLCQAYLSAASLAQLLVRGHSRGVDWPIWAARTLGTAFGLYGYYGYRWWLWPEGHEYVVTPFSLFLCSVALLADLVYPIVFARVSSQAQSGGVH